MPDISRGMAPTHTSASRADDQERFRTLWSEHYRPVFAFAIRRVRTPEAAHDVVSETFLTAWRRRDKLPPGMERPWLLGIAKRIAANDRRSVARFDALVERLTTTLATSASPEARPPGGPDETAVATAFARLSVTDQEALSLVVWDDLSPREASIVLGVATPRFSVRLHRAKQRLRTHLAALAEDVPVALQPPPARRSDPSKLETR